MKSKTVVLILSITLFSQIGFSQWCSTLTNVSIGENHTLVLDDNGYLWACGGGGNEDAMGLGNGVGTVLSLQRVLCGETNTFSGYLENIVHFDAGWYHSLAVLDDGRCLSFGRDGEGQLGNGSNGSSSVPIFVHGLNDNPGGLQDIVKVSAGRSGTHSLAVDSSGYVYAWGNNASKQCGGSSQNSQYQYPELVIDTDGQTINTYLGDEVFIVDVDAGVSHSLALSDDGYVYEWGNNTIPHKVSGENGSGYLSNIVDIATCYNSLAVDSTGNVWYWTVGNNPQKIPGGEMGTTYLENIVKVAAGHGAWTALDSNGNVWEWQSDSSPYPVQVTDGEQNTASGYLEDIVAFDVGYYKQRIAIDSFGYGWAWGVNQSGSLGIGTQSSPSEPTKMLCAEITRLYMDKTDDVEDGQSADLDSNITYTIEWQNTTGQTFYDVYIHDVLPVGVTYSITYTVDPNTMDIVPSDPFYQKEDHTYLYPIGTLAPDDFGSLQLQVTVNSASEPGYHLHNVADMWATVYDPNGHPSEQKIGSAYVDTLVRCWDTHGVLCVDKNATGNNSGASWTNAYTDLQDALDRARSSQCTVDYVIYVAQEEYSPGDDENASFGLPDGVSLYGGFPTGGCEFSQRNPKRYKTTLTGKIDDTHRNTTVVVMGDETLLDGFTITSAALGGQCIYGSGVDFSLVNSTIENSDYRGIRATGGNVTLQWCQILDNDSDGVFHQGGGFVLNCENCWIRRNKGRGLYCSGSTPIIQNSIVTESDLGRAGNEGIRMVNPENQPVLHNLTIAHNKSFGIAQAGGPLPDMKNSVVYHNGGPALSGFSADDAASFCCIEDCNSVNENINVDPEFVYFDPNNVHIGYNSPCKDTGSLSLNYDGQVDMDKRVRVLGTRVDRGAYEVNPDCESDSNIYDTNHDGLVNYAEFVKFSAAWLSRDPNDPSLPSDPNFIDPNDFTNWNPSCDLNEDYIVNLPDIVTFVDDAPWLWRACWYVEEGVTETTAGGSEMLLMSRQSLAAEESQTITEMTIFEENPITEQTFNLAQSIVFLEQIWLQDPLVEQEIDAVTWQQFMDAMYQNLADLQTEPVRLE